MFFYSGYFYLATIILQAVCVFHCIRKGNQQQWIWLIVFLPIVGCVVYFFSEILTRQQVSSVSTGLSGVIKPAGSIRKLEENLRFSDTFNNQIALADAYQQKKRFQEAIQLYERGLTGAFEENEYGISRLMAARFAEQNYQEVVKLAARIQHQPQFPRSGSHIQYAISLGKTGHPDEAEKEFRTLNGRFSNYEARYYYSLFLQQQNRTEDARKLLTDLLAEVKQLSGRERRYNREWIGKSRETLKKMQ